MLRYLFKMREYRGEIIDVSSIEATLQSMFPKARIVGDKYPAYVFMLNQLTAAEGLSRVIIYRDCRDVTSSTLKKVRIDWRNKPFAEKLNTAEKVAKRWVHAMELMERNVDYLYPIRYEDFVRDPKRTAEALGRWLGVDPMRFPTHFIKDSSVGKYKGDLTNDELATVMEIAGPVMARVGYL